MDPHFTEFSDSIDAFGFDDDAFIPNFDQSETAANPFKFKDETLDFTFMDLPSFPPDPYPGNVAPTSSISRSSEVDSPDGSDNSDDVLKFINSILMEENLEQKPSMFHDPLSLQATEKSLYDVIGEKYPAPSNQPPLYYNQNVESPDDNMFGSSSEQSSNSNTTSSSTVDSQWSIDPGENKSYGQSHPFGYPFESNFQVTSQRSFGSMNSFSNDVNGPMASSMSSHLIANIFSDSESILQFKRGMEEASKFLPTSNKLIIDLDSYAPPPDLKEGTSEVVVKVEKDEKEFSTNNGSRGRKNHLREDGTLEEERSSKQSAVYMGEDEEDELSEMFDKVLLYTVVKGDPACCDVDEEVQHEETNNSQHNVPPHVSSDGKTRAKKQGNKKELMDLRTLLISCAQSVAADDRRSANEQLRQIRLHSTPSGDGSQRLAHIFANSLEARMAGTGTQIYSALASKRISAAQKLKAYSLYLSSCPFKRMTIFYAAKTILDLATESTKKKLHIIDFGIQYGFQWPIVIQHLENLPGGTPELRMTGIELPQPGFRPAELVEETGRRLAKYCDRFNVPFQYHAIAQKWETIKIEDLNIRSDEVLVVNCLFQFDYLLDETVVEDSPRDAVLKLIRKMNPDVFIHAVINGSYNAPFFLTRFREALFHYSSAFDMFDTNINREDQERMHFEQEFYGREVMNVVACEGLERVVRPETYKQWLVRTTRAGFRILPLQPELVKKLRGKVKAGYHKDFVIDEDGQWMLQGWKGRIFCANSCWIPS